MLDIVLSLIQLGLYNNRIWCRCYDFHYIAKLYTNESYLKSMSQKLVLYTQNVVWCYLSLRKHKASPGRVVQVTNFSPVLIILIG